MTTPGPVLEPVSRCLFALGLMAAMGAVPCRGVELRVSRAALERTLRQQLFHRADLGADGGATSDANQRYYLKGTARSACSVYVEDAQLSFAQDRIVVKVKTHARLGEAIGGACVGLSLTPTSEVSVEPYGEGESVGFRDAQLTKVSDRRQLNFLLAPFLSRQIPRSLKVDAAELLRRALEGSTASSGYKVSLDKLKIHSVQIEGDDLVLDVDGALSVK
ncbi:MAG TPA: hypothetical protein VE291_02010 [Terracidiphilus sp.]|jgi:hypothetical protein|nr:hypothetical protein [Terracidiphilus sp.]